MKALILSLSIALSLCSCTRNQALKDNNTVLPLANPKIVLIQDQSIAGTNDNDNAIFWTPNAKQYNQIDSLIRIAINENQQPYFTHLKSDSLDKYCRQYVCYENKNRHLIIFVNAFYFRSSNNKNTSIDSKDKPANYQWLHEIVNVCDGGEFFWNVTIDLTKMKYYDFSVNGEA